MDCSGSADVAVQLNQKNGKATVSINISSHSDMGSTSGKHGGKCFSGDAADGNASEASTADTDGIDACLRRAVEDINDDVKENPEMAKIYEDCLEPLMQDSAMVGNIQTSMNCASSVMKNSHSQIEGFKKLIEEICNDDQEEKKKRTDALGSVFNHVDSFTSKVLDMHAPLQQFLTSQTLGIRFLRSLKEEASKPAPDKKTLEKLSAMTSKHLGKAKMSDELQAQLTAIKDDSILLAKEVQSESSAIEQLKVKHSAKVKAAKEAADRRMEEVMSAKNLAAEATKTAAWWSACSFAAVCGLSIIGGICVGVACAAGGWAIAPALVVAGHAVGWTCLAGAAVIGGGSAAKAYYDGAEARTNEENKKLEAESEHRRELEKLEAYQAQLEEIKVMSIKFQQLNDNINKARAATEIVKAHVVFLAEAGEELSEQAEFVDMVKAVKLETLVNFEARLETLKQDCEDMIDAAITAKRKFIEKPVSYS